MEKVWSEGVGCGVCGCEWWCVSIEKESESTGQKKRKDAARNNWGKWNKHYSVFDFFCWGDVDWIKPGRRYVAV